MLTLGVWIIAILLALRVLGLETCLKIFALVIGAAFTLAFIGGCILGAVLAVDHYGQEAIGVMVAFLCAIGIYRTNVGENNE